MGQDNRERLDGACEYATFTGLLRDAGSQLVIFAPGPFTVKVYEERRGRSSMKIVYRVKICGGSAYADVFPTLNEAKAFAESRFQARTSKWSAVNPNTPA